jgi:hypothetical protein
MKPVLRFLALLAVLLSPLSMIAPSHAMMATAAAKPTEMHGADHEAAVDADQASEEMAASSHCAPAEDQDGSPPGRSPDCAIACAALPSGGAGLKARAPLARTIAPLPPAAEPHGLDPEAATPPPRFS